MRFIRPFLILLALVVAMACGGGGDGPSTSMTVTPGSLTFTAQQGAALPRSQSISFTYTGDGFMVGTPTGESLPSWANPYLASQSTKGGVITVDITSTQLTPGTYTMTLRFLAGLKDGSHLVTRDVAITYTVTQAPPVISLQAPALDFRGGEIAAPSPISVQVQSTSAPFAWALEVAADGGNPSDWLTVSNPGGTSTSTSVTVQAQAALRTAGNYAAYLVLKDGAGKELSRARATYTSGAGFTLSSTPSMTVTQASAAAALTSGFDILTTFNPTHGAAVGWTLTSDQPWVTCTPASGTFASNTHVTVVLDPEALWTLTSGQHTANLILAVPSASNLSTTVPVALSLSLNPALVLQGGASFRINTATTEASLAGQLQVATNLGPAFDRAISWTATSDAPWLKLTTASGTTGSGSAVAFKVDGAALANLPSPATARLTLVPGTAGVAAATTDIPLTLAVPTFTVLSPYVGWTGRPSPVILRGSGFTTSGAFQVQVGGVPVTPQIIDDTEARLTVPAFASAQRAPVRVSNALGADLGGPDLVVMDPPAYAAADLACPGSFEMQLDPERNAVLTYGWSATQMVRHAFRNGAWATDGMNVQFPTAAAVAPDGKEILVVGGLSGSQTLAIHVDPADLNLLRYDPLPSFYANYDYVATWNDGIRWLLNSNQWASILEYPRLANVQLPQSIYSIGAVMSLDRSVMVVGSTGGISPADPQVHSISVKGKAWVPRVLYDGNLTPPSAGISRDGSRFVHQTSVYDASFNRLGALTPEVSVTCLAVSPDGANVITSSMDDSSTTTFRLHALSGAVGPFPAQAILPVGLPAGNYVRRMVISQDGGTLFILYGNSIGSSYLKVFPLN